MCVLEADQTMMPECWNEIRQILLVIVQAADYHMHFQVVAMSENQRHWEALILQSAGSQSPHLLHQNLNSPVKQ